MSVVEFLRVSAGGMLDPDASATSPHSAAKYTTADARAYDADELDQGYLEGFVLAGRITYRMILLSAAGLYLFNQFTGHLRLD